MDKIYKEWEKHAADRLPKDRIDCAYRGMRRKMDRPARRRRAALSACGVFAALCLVAMPLLSIHIYKDGNGRPHETDMCELATRYGESRTALLPDGTSVTLNAGSVLIYPESFEGQSSRRVYLTGEAKFDVARNEQLPFIVNTIDFAVKVHGTVFDINSYPDKRISSVTLCSGSISAEMNGSGKTVGMVPDQCLTYNRDSGSYELTGVNSREYTAWETGDVCFNSESIHNIASVVERRFGVNVYITSGKYDEACITAKFLHGETLDEVMNAVCRLVPGMKYRIENDNVYIK